MPPYAGQNQPSQIAIPRATFYQQEPEEGCWVMPPYQWIFPHPAPAEVHERGTDSVHAQWLKTHPLSKNHQRRMGDGNRRPVSKIPPFIRAKPIKQKPIAEINPRRMGDPAIRRSK